MIHENKTHKTKKTFLNLTVTEKYIQQLAYLV